MATILLPPDFKEFLQLLNSEAIEYLLVGGYAVGYYGYPRSTGDMDIWIHATSDNAVALVKVLERFGFAAKTLSPAVFLQPDKVVRMGVPPLRIDLLTNVSGVVFTDCYLRRVLATVDGVAVNLIGLDDLKTNKKAIGRSKDLDDLEHL